MRKVIFAVLINALALWIAHNYVLGFDVRGGIQVYAVAGLVLGLLNLIVKPILKVIAFPLMLISLGLFALVINGLLLWFMTSIVPSVVIDGFMPLVWGTGIVTAGNIILNWVK